MAVTEEGFESGFGVASWNSPWAASSRVTGDAHSGSYSVKSTAANQGSLPHQTNRYELWANVGPATAYRAYYKITQLPPSGSILSLLGSYPWDPACFYVMSDGTVCFDYISLTLGTYGSSQTVVNVNEWFRLEVHVTGNGGPGHPAVRLFAGANAESTTPSSEWDATVWAETQPGVFLTNGAVQASNVFARTPSGYTGDIFVDDFAYDLTTPQWIGPVGGGPPPPAPRKGWGITR